MLLQRRSGVDTRRSLAGWLTGDVTKERAVALAATLRVGLNSPGVCPACISFVAIELESGNERRVAGQITSFAPLLWGEGLGELVRGELERQAREGSADAAGGAHGTRGPAGSEHDLSRGRAAPRRRARGGGEAFADRVYELVEVAVATWKAAGPVRS